MGVDRAAIGLVQAAVSIPGVLLSVLIGYLADRFGRRRVILTSLLIFATFGVAGFWARSFWGLVGVRFLQGVGTSGCMGLTVVIVGDLFEGKERTHAMGYNLSGVTLFNMVGPGISGLIGGGGVFRPFLIFLVGYRLALWATRMPADPLRAAVSPLVHARAALASLRRDGHAIDYLGMSPPRSGPTWCYTGSATPPHRSIWTRCSVSIPRAGALSSPPFRSGSCWRRSKSAGCGRRWAAPGSWVWRSPPWRSARRRPPPLPPGGRWRWRWG